MSAFLEGISRSFCIWPKNDYSKFIPKRSPSSEAWSNVGKLLANNILQYDRMLESKGVNDDALASARGIYFKSYFTKNIDSSDIDVANMTHLVSIFADIDESQLKKDNLLHEISNLKMQLQKLEIELQEESDVSNSNHD
ncbi:hypothetical protein QFY08_000305 [Vibrio alginolyticus]|nr:hypothetical protein [Vibrio alginolyticus]